MHHPEEVQVDDAPELVGRRVGKGRVERDGAGVYPGVQAPVGADRPRGDRLHPRGVGRLRRDGHRPPARRADLLYERVETLLLGRGYHQPGTPAGQVQRGLAPQAHRRAVHDDGLFPYRS